MLALPIFGLNTEGRISDVDTSRDFSLQSAKLPKYTKCSTPSLFCPLLHLFIAAWSTALTTSKIKHFCILGHDVQGMFGLRNEKDFALQGDSQIAETILEVQGSVYLWEAMHTLSRRMSASLSLQTFKRQLLIWLDVRCRWNEIQMILWQCLCSSYTPPITSRYSQSPLLHSSFNLSCV